MEGEAGAAALQVLVQNLIDLSKNEISLIGGLESDAAKLSGSLDTIQKFLSDAETRAAPRAAVKSWLKRLEDAAFDADNVLDELNYHRLSEQIDALKPLDEKVLSCFSSFNRVARRRKMALEIKEINDNLDSINNDASKLGLLANESSSVNVNAYASSESDSFTFDPIFIGRDDVVSEIVRNVTACITADEHKISIISIWGMGGLGKTTLTRKVFNHHEVEARFGSRIWVHVSQDFDPVVLFKKILRELNCVGIEGSGDSMKELISRQDTLRRLKEALKDKTYLLVLDDVWNELPHKWEAFMNSLLGVTSTNRNAIIVTTRNKEVASVVKPFHTHKLKGLSEKYCWSIIKAKAFREGDVPTEFEEIGKRIARRCRGLPLAANVVGGILSNNKSEEKWRSIEEKWLSRDEGENITKILRLSFDNLSPPSLKKCFTYCSIFPKGGQIMMHELIECWMAEGFLHGDGDGSNVMESVGDKFTKILLHNSLLQVVEKDDYGNVKSCTMHDLVHDLACSVLGSFEDAGGSGRVRYMFLEGKSSPIQNEVTKHLRTLFLKVETPSTMLISDLECVHVLTLDSDDKELPSCIRKCIHLRFLNISRTRISNMPEWIGELHHLQTLRASTYHLEKLPSTLKYLINLRHLYINEYVKLPPRIGRLTSLQTLTHFRVRNKKGYKIEELGSLTDLIGAIQIRNLEKVCDKEEAEKANLFKKSKLLELWLRWDRYREESETNDENVLEGLHPHPNLMKLVLECFKGKMFPSWTLKMEVENKDRGSWVGLNKLIDIRLIDCSECEEIPMLGHLPNLKSLRLEKLKNVKCINSSFYGLVNKETGNVFPVLERLELSDMSELVEFAECASDQVKVFPQLQYLEIKWCWKLMSVPSHFSSSLKHVEVMGMGSFTPLSNIMGNRLTLLKNLTLACLNDLECVPDWLFYNNPNLSYLDIWDCSKLRELPESLWGLNSLKDLRIRDCACLERIANPNRGEQSKGSCFAKLFHLKIHVCHALVYLPCELVGPSLEILSFKDLSSLENLPSLIDCLPKSPRLRELTIEGVPTFMATSSCDEIWPLGSLQELHIDVSKRGSCSGSVETVDAILRGCCHSLTWLSLKGMESLPQSIQQLTAVTLLEFDNFGVEELPEWLGNLSSLKWLYLYNCKEFRHLPSMAAIRRLTSLESLYIKGCPKLCLKPRCDGRSEWPKISHIPKISIDGSKLNAVNRCMRNVCLGCI